MPDSLEALVHGPQYKYIAAVFRRRIFLGEYREGDRLPSETEICEEFGVSRMTARQAVTLLVNAGQVQRIQGSGAFVTSGRLERDLNTITGFHEDFASMGLDPGAEVISRERRRPTQMEQQKLGVSPQQEVVAVTRLRTLSGVPIGVQTMVVPISVVPDIEIFDLEHRSFYAHLRELGKPLTRAEQHIAAVVRPDIAEQLGIDPGIPYLQMDRVSFVGDLAVEHLVSSFRADKYAYHVTLTATPEGEP